MTSIKNTLAAAVERKRLLPEDIDAEIASEHYFTAGHAVGSVRFETYPEGVAFYEALDSLTFCVLILRNGTKVVGINYGAIDPAQHRAERGREEAAKDARNKVWELLGYALRDQISAAKSSVTN